MKVAWIQDLNPWTELGGAQQTDKTHILSGIKKEHEIEIMLPGQDTSLLKWADTTIVSNASAFPIQMFREMKKPYVFFLHDYWALCKWRLYYPMLEKCKDCHIKPNWLPILQGSSLIIWLSPLHRESWLFTYPELVSHPFALVPSPVSPDLFFDMNTERKGAIAVSSGLVFKGRERFVEWAEKNSETEITLLGPSEGDLPANVKVINFVPQAEMNALYNKHKIFVHLPTTPMPFDRSVAEAYLAGCRVIGNKNIGALSWDQFWQGRAEVEKMLRLSPGQFWDVVESVA